MFLLRNWLTKYERMQTKMNINLKKSVAAILLASQLVVPISVSYAGTLQDTLDGMFSMSNVTQPGSFNTQMMGGFVGGGFSLRVPTNTINLVAFDPPRFSVGCGGIDMYLGSFSFINSQELITLFRSIAQGAVAALFQLAVNVVSKDIGKMMGDFQNIVQQLNSLAKNSCSITESIVHNEVDPAASQTQQASNSAVFAPLTGAAQDFMNDVNNTFFSPSSGAAASDKASSPSGTAGTGSNPAYGNLIWKALAQSQAGSMLGPTAGLTDTTNNGVEANEIIMSMVGTYIYGSPSTTTGTNGAPMINQPSPKPAILTLHDFEKPSLPPSSGTTPEIPIYSCGTDTAACMTPTQISIPFMGVDGYVKQELFGSADGTVTSAGIVSELDNCSGASIASCLTPEQYTFLNLISDTPILSLIQRTSLDSNGQNAVLMFMVDYIDMETMVSYGIAAVSAANQVFSGAANVPKPKNYDSSMRELRHELVGYEMTAAKLSDKILQANQYVNIMIKTHPALFVRTGRR